MHYNSLTGPLLYLWISARIIRLLSCVLEKQQQKFTTGTIVGNWKLFLANWSKNKSLKIQYVRFYPQKLRIKPWLFIQASLASCHWKLNQFNWMKNHAFIKENGCHLIRKVMRNGARRAIFHQVDFSRQHWYKWNLKIVFQQSISCNMIKKYIYSFMGMYAI